MKYEVTVERSSVIRALFFKNGLLGIAFTHGATYFYSKVSEEVFFSLCKAKSMGEYFARNIRGKYFTLKVV